MTGLLGSALAGLFLGPLLNYLIDYLPPVDEDARRSPTCAGRTHLISMRMLVPVLGYVSARGRCPVCGEPLSLRRPLVELALAGLFALSWQRFEADTFQFAAVCAFALVLLALAVMDLETQFLPDRLVFPGIVAALAASPFWPGLNPWDGAAGAAAGFVVFYPLAWYGDRTGREIMGWGDIKFSALLGAVLGLQMLILGLYLGVLLGGLAALAVVLVRSRGSRPRVLPYGTFLALGGLAALYYGRTIIDWAQDSLL